MVLMLAIVVVEPVVLGTVVAAAETDLEATSRRFFIAILFLYLLLSAPMVVKRVVVSSGQWCRVGSGKWGDNYRNQNANNSADIHGKDMATKVAYNT